MEESRRQVVTELKEVRDWEGAIVRWACGLARALAERLLGEVDAALAEEREAGWVIEGMRTHTIATRSGESCGFGCQALPLPLYYSVLFGRRCALWPRARAAPCCSRSCHC